MFATPGIRCVEGQRSPPKAKAAQKFNNNITRPNRHCFQFALCLGRKSSVSGRLLLCAMRAKQITITAPERTNERREHR